MDLSVQKMQPPASVQGKSAAKKASRSGTLTEDEAVESTERDEKARFAHGNTGYERSEQDDQQDHDPLGREPRRRRRGANLLSGEDLSQLTMSMEQASLPQQSADGLMNLRAYKTASAPQSADDEHNFDRNI